MKYLSIALIYIAFFTLIGLEVYITKSLWALWVLILTPSYKHKSGDGN